jgi:hypothetical protein
MHPPADRRCQIYVGEAEDNGLHRCGKDGTHWESWPSCSCDCEDDCDGDFYSWECDGPHDPRKEAA